MQSLTTIKFLMLIVNIGLMTQAHANSHSASSSSLTRPLNEQKEHKTSSSAIMQPTLQDRIDLLQDQLDIHEKRIDTLQQQIATLNSRISSQAMEIRALNVNTTHVTMDPKAYAQWRKTVQMKLVFLGILSVAAYSVATLLQ